MSRYCSDAARRRSKQSSAINRRMQFHAAREMRYRRTIDDLRPLADDAHSETDCTSAHRMRELAALHIEQRRVSTATENCPTSVRFRQSKIDPPGLGCSGVDDASFLFVVESVAVALMEQRLPIHQYAYWTNQSGQVSLLCTMHVRSIRTCQTRPSAYPTMSCPSSTVSTCPFLVGLLNNCDATRHIRRCRLPTKC